MAGFETYQEYQRIEDYEEDSPPGEEDLLIHVPEGRGDPWHHIKNLDNFFTRISFKNMKTIFLDTLTSIISIRRMDSPVWCYQSFLNLCKSYLFLPETLILWGRTAYIPLQN
uniref:Autophagy-related protein 9A-like n=1 Tax=Sinocyclocheilus grahami TaxID=75366 RepID=A0A672LNM8_SINGR